MVARTRSSRPVTAASRLRFSCTAIAVTHTHARSEHRCDSDDWTRKIARRGSGGQVTQRVRAGACAAAHGSQRNMNSTFPFEGEALRQRGQAEGDVLSAEIHSHLTARFRTPCPKNSFCQSSVGSESVTRLCTKSSTHARHLCVTQVALHASRPALQCALLPAPSSSCCGVFPLILILLF